MSEGRKIYCVCNKYMGEIRDATLRTGLVFLCVDCDTKRKAADMAMRNKKTSDPIMDDFFSGIFEKR